MLWELAQPLYKLLTETQKTQTNNLVSCPDTQKEFKAFQTALLQAPTLSLLTGLEFNLFVTERKCTALIVTTQLQGPHQPPVPYLDKEYKSNCCFSFMSA